MAVQRPAVIIRSQDRYTTLRRIEGWSQDRLKQASVLVAGVGALGNEILKNLALLGLGHIVLVDFDRIELPNLTRSVLFREADEQQPKAEIAARAVHAINPGISVSMVFGDVAWEVGEGVFRRMDVMIGGLDNRQARLALNRRCWRVGRPWVDGALAASAGAVRVFVPPASACYECTLTSADYHDLNLRYSCQGIALEGIQEGKIPTTPTVASIIGAMQVQEALKLLHGQPVLAGHEILYDAGIHTLQIVELKRRADCLGHSHLGQIEEVLEFRTAQTTAGQLLARAQADLGDEAQVELDREVVIGMVCPNRHAREWQPMPSFRVRERDVNCLVCGDECELMTTHIINVSSPHLERPLSQWGIPPAHIVRARCGRKILYYELTGDVPQVLPWTISAKREVNHV